MYKNQCKDAGKDHFECFKITRAQLSVSDKLTFFRVILSVSNTQKIMPDFFVQRPLGLRLKSGI